MAGSTSDYEIDVWNSTLMPGLVMSTMNTSLVTEGSGLIDDGGSAGPSGNVRVADLYTRPLYIAISLLGRYQLLYFNRIKTRYKIKL